MSNTESNAAAYFHKPGFNARERLICSHLIEGINAEPLETILHTTQAALLLDDDKLDALEIDGRLALSLYTTAQRLKTPEITLSGYDNQKKTYGLALRTSDYAYDIAPWFRGYKVSAEPREMEDFNERKPGMSPEEKIDFITSHLSHEGYHSLVNDFLFYATPLIQEIGGILATTISPESYTELFKLIKGEEP